MSATVRYEPVAYCADCVDGCDWDNEPEEWAKKHNTEHHTEGTK